MWDGTSTLLPLCHLLSVLRGKTFFGLPCFCYSKCVHMFVLFNLDTEQKLSATSTNRCLCVVPMVTALSVKCKCSLGSVGRGHREIQQNGSASVLQGIVHSPHSQIDCGLQLCRPSQMNTYSSSFHLYNVCSAFTIEGIGSSVLLLKYFPLRAFSNILFFFTNSLSTCASQK